MERLHKHPRRHTPHVHNATTPRTRVCPPPPPPPQWFEDLGGFEQPGSVALFVEWALKAVQLFGTRITYWATFNEPTVGGVLASRCSNRRQLSQTGILPEKRVLSCIMSAFTTNAYTHDLPHQHNSAQSGTLNAV
jgi:beta-glucosidase/6-phospho-beta-glucosidase/beta-galactosidase